MGFSRQEYWSGLPCPPPGDLHDPGMEPVSPMSHTLAGEFFMAEPPGKRKVNYAAALLLSHFSRVQLFATPWTAAYQAPQSMGFSRQEYWSGVPLPSPKVNYRKCQMKYGEIEGHRLSEQRGLQLDPEREGWGS